MNVFIQGRQVSLTQRDYVASGGEGDVFAKGQTGYKVYHDPKKMLPLGKIRELQEISNPNVIRPLDILTDKANKPLGYTMRFIPDAWALCQMFPKAFRDRNGVKHPMVQEMVKELQRLFVAVHAARILIVDANEMNFLLTKDFRVVMGIDADSYQTPHYPATAIMDSVRDWTVTPPHWTEGSDWYSFACVSFQMFTGLHPYKGQHPTIKGMVDRMKAGVSVFDKDVGVPPIAYDFSVIPKNYLDWYKRVFVKGERSDPPSIAGVVVIAAVKPSLVSGKGVIEIEEVAKYDSNVVRFWTDNSRIVTVTNKTVWMDRRQVGPAPQKASGCGFSKTGVPILADGGSEVPVLTDLQSQQNLPFDLRADEVSSVDGRIYIRAVDHVYEVILTEAGNRVVATTKPVANVMPNASRLYPGVIVQNMLGSVFVSVLARSGASYQVRVKELDKYRVLDARCDSGVLMVVGEKSGKYDRLVLRFDEDFTAYDVRVVSDIQMVGLNFVVLDSGVCVCLNEEGRVEIFSKKMGSAQVKEIDDPVVPGDAVLGKSGGTVMFSQGNRIFRMKMRK